MQQQQHTSSSRSSSRRRMLRSGFSVRDPSQPHFELVNNISSLIQQGSDVITKYSGFVSKLQQNKYQFHLLFHYRGTWTRDRRLAGRLVRSFTSIMISSLPHCPLHLAVYFFVILTDSRSHGFAHQIVLKDLATKPTKIKYGSVGSGSTFSFFRVRIAFFLKWK